MNLYQRETDNFKRIKLPSNDIWSLAYDDNNHQLLIGTLSRGLYFLDLNTNEIDNITIDDGLAGESVFCILRDGTDFWASTNVGLSKISADKTITNFYWRHGLQDGYNYNSCASSKVGELFFGGGTGLSYFYPKNLKTDTTVPVVHITRLSLYDAKSNRFNHFKMGDAKPLFSYEQNNINIEFTGIYYTAPDKLAYEYRLLNHNRQWISVESGNLDTLSPNKDALTAKYTNLSPGNYDFQVRAISPDNIASNIASYPFSITPPWWKTGFAFFAYFLVVVALVYFIYKFRVKLILDKNLKLEAEVKTRTAQLEKKTQLANKLSEDKKRLFENVSHEFRTPLTLIIASVDDLSVEEGLKEHKNLDSIKRNSYRLLKMVEQLLDFASIENGHQPKVKQYEVVACINEVLSAFESLFIDKELKVEFNSEQSFFVALTEDALEKILVNLISNALSAKFNCIHAYNGQEGIESAISTIPDIVICDVMMPIKDGFDVLNVLKNDEKTAHIPFMMLTAKGDLKSRMQGWES